MEALRDIAAGTVGGVCGIVVGHPLDTVKVRMQTSAARMGMMGCIAQTVRQEGPLAFFRGLTSPIAAAAPVNATLFFVYGGVSRLMGSSDEEDLPSYKLFVAGSAAGLAQCAFTIPAELLKIKCQVSHSPLHPMDMARKLYSKAGIGRGLFQGAAITCARDVPAFGIYFTSYEWSRSFLFEHGLSLHTSAFLSGGIAGSASFLFLHPIDVLKSCRQQQPIDTPIEQTKLSYLVRHNVQKNGVRYFLRGAWPSVIRAFPVSAVTFTVVETLLEHVL